MREQHIEAAWPAGERVLVNVDASPNAQRVIRRAWRLANRLQAEMTAVFVETPRWASAGPEERRSLEENLRFAEDLGAEVVRIQESDVSTALLQAARDRNAGSIVVGRPAGGRLRLLLGRSPLPKLLRLATDVDVHVVAAGGEEI
jgi:two-component system sensor histidine kinase KdpD